MRQTEYQLVVFDWDGTLIDSIGTIVACTQATLTELGLPATEDETIRASVGLGIREMVEAFCPGCDDSTFGRIVEVYRRLWFGRFSANPNLFEGVPELLDELVAGGRTLAIATAKSRKGLTADLKRTGLEGRFASSRTVDEAPGKPHPQMLLDILEELCFSSDAALMVGDAAHDLEMAQNAGIDAVGVTSGTVSRERLLAHEPKDCLDRVTALSGWLQDQASRPNQSL